MKPDRTSPCTGTGLALLAAAGERESWAAHGRYCACSRTVTTCAPVFEFESSESSKVTRVHGHEHQTVDVRNGGDLAVDERNRFAGVFEPRTFSGVPRGSRFIVGENRKRGVDHVCEIFLERSTSFAKR